MSNRMVGSVVLSALAVLAVGCSSKEAPAVHIRPVRSMVVQPGASFGGRVFPGRAEAVQAVDLAFEVQGQLVVPRAMDSPWRSPNRCRYCVR